MSAVANGLGHIENLSKTEMPRSHYWLRRFNPAAPLWHTSTSDSVDSALRQVSPTWAVENPIF